jgi:hypothetical protein
LQVVVLDKAALVAMAVVDMAVLQLLLAMGVLDRMVVVVVDLVVVVNRDQVLVATEWLFFLCQLQNTPEYTQVHQP